MVKDNCIHPILIYVLECGDTSPHSKLHLALCGDTSPHSKLHLALCGDTSPHSKLHLALCGDTSPHSKLPYFTKPFSFKNAFATAVYSCLSPSTFQFIVDSASLVRKGASLFRTSLILG